MSDKLRIALKGGGIVRVSIQQGSNKDFFLEAVEDWGRLTSVERAVIKADQLAAAEEPDGLIWETLKALVQECHINREARERIAALAPPPNEPLTLEQFREMGGVPVWLAGEGLNKWDICRGFLHDGFEYFWREALPVEEYGKTWTAYPREKAL